MSSAKPDAPSLYVPADPHGSDGRGEGFMATPHVAILAKLVHRVCV